jgi:hypothetical protein
MVMAKIKTAISLVLIAAAILFAGNVDVFAGAGSHGWITGTAPKGSTTWTGTLVITAEIANVPGSPAPGLPADAEPTPAPPSGALYKDLVVKIEFFVRLENSKKGYGTFSGLAKELFTDPTTEIQQTYYYYYALGDYANGRIAEALDNFLKNEVYPSKDLPGGPWQGGVLTSVTNDQSNVGTQLRLDQNGRESLQPETPLYYSADITVATY